jgi:hypothetical protein
LLGKLIICSFQQSKSSAGAGRGELSSHSARACWACWWDWFGHRSANHTSQILRRVPLKYYTLYGISVFGIRTTDLLYRVTHPYMAKYRYSAIYYRVHRLLFWGAGSGRRTEINSSRFLREILVALQERPTTHPGSRIEKHVILSSLCPSPRLLPLTNYRAFCLQFRGGGRMCSLPLLFSKLWCYLASPFKKKVAPYTYRKHNFPVHFQRSL